MIEQISNEELRLEHLPGPLYTWKQANKFALTFNGYEYHKSFDVCAETANKALKMFNKNGSLPSSLVDLRTCLFFEQRRYHHYGWDPDEKAMVYIRALVEAIKDILK